MDIRQLEGKVDAETLKAIHDIPLSAYNRTGRMVWLYEKSESFSVKTTYTLFKKSK